MKASKCQVCGEAHWRYEPHAWKSDPKRAAVADPRSTKPDAPARPLESRSKADDGGVSRGEAKARQSDAAARQTGGSPAPKFDRNAYQREYMKKRRAEDRERRARQKETT